MDSQRPKLRNSEQGIVAIMTTLVLMLVISLIVLGFAQIARRNERQALDRQLSTQAFYAAESGVNDARKVMSDAIAAGQQVRDKNECTGSGTAGFYAGLDPDIDPARNVKYTCLLVDASPKTLSYNDIGTTSTIVPVISEDGSPISRIKLDWQSKQATGNPAAGCPTTAVNVFAPATNWNCGYGVLRFDLVPTAGTANMDGLQSNTMTTFAVPLSSGGVTQVPYPATVPANTTNTNNRIGVRCTNAGCSLEITNLSQNNYHLRITSLYKDVALQVSALGATGSQLEITGSQATIDSTGKAQDVLRRIQVHVPLRSSSTNELSDYAIEMNGSLCKRYAIMSGFISNQTPGVASTNQLCQTFTSP